MKLDIIFDKELFMKGKGERQMNERVKKNLGYVANGIKDIIGDCNSILVAIEDPTEMEDVFYVEDKLGRMMRNIEILKDRTRKIPDMFDEED